MSRSNQSNSADRKHLPNASRFERSEPADDPQVPPHAGRAKPLASMCAGEQGRVLDVLRDPNGRAERLAALGVTPGARVRVLQTFPGLVFECDQTELAVERNVARVIIVDVDPAREDAGRVQAMTFRTR